MGECKYVILIYCKWYLNRYGYRRFLIIFTSGATQNFSRWGREKFGIFPKSFQNSNFQKWVLLNPKSERGMDVSRTWRHQRKGDVWHLSPVRNFLPVAPTQLKLPACIHVYVYFLLPMDPIRGRRFSYLKYSLLTFNLSQRNMAKSQSFEGDFSNGSPLGSFSWTP